MKKLLFTKGRKVRYNSMKMKIVLRDRKLTIRKVEKAFTFTQLEQSTKENIRMENNMGRVFIIIQMEVSL